MSSNSSSSSGIGFCGLLAVAFIVLKLTGYIDWTWTWVLAPIWIPWVITLGVLVLAGLCYGLKLLLKRRRRRRLRRPR